MKRRTPFKWYGSKTKLTALLLRIMPEHRAYVEVFGGSAALLFAKRPSRVEVYNDLDAEPVNFLEVLRDPTQAQALRDQLELTPYAEKEYEACLRAAPTDDPVERARQFFVLCNQSINGRFKGSWSRDRRSNRAKTFHHSLDTFVEACSRLQSVVIESKDFEPLVQYHDGPDALFYMDPPYYPETRSAKAQYQREMTAKDHERLLGLVQTIQGMVILHGYRHPVYDDALRRWRRIDVPVRSDATVIKRRDRRADRPKRSEIIWTNFDPPDNSQEHEDETDFGM